MTAIQTSNPAFNFSEADNPFAYREGRAIAPSNVTTMSGVVNKTALLATIAIVCGAAGYALFQHFPQGLWIGSIVSFVLVLGIFFKLRSSPQAAVYLGPVYAIVQGALMGGFTMMLEQILIAKFGSSVPGGLAFSALLLTGGVFAAMLLLYKAGVLRPTRLFVSVVSTATLGVMLAYVAMFVMSFFGMQMPFLSIGSALDGGTAALIGIGLNVAILGLAAFWLIIDFGTVEESVAQGAPKYMEWYCAFALLVTLAWIYWEAVKLVFRIAALAKRD
ncbi:MAG TPA: Bax inhibitor-1/YccA family protein [Phycisphaerales bacterium]|nr:Bax inhibitor-1/YccA family protein [Phycisphaerales bacterium]HMP36180.1 Bax inhibitor-1/YccA family protein [Phycisphaerales bacterium]